MVQQNINININDFIFGRTKAEKKLEVIKATSDAEMHSVRPETILRIYKECRGDRDRFYIDRQRARGNNWNSTIEFIYEYKNKPYLCLYVQSCSSDSSTCVSFSEFNGRSYHGYCENLHMNFTYSSIDIADTIRCILEEYVYWKYIERVEREKRERIGRLLHYKIFNPVLNQFYDEWRCKYEGFGWGSPTPRTDRYHRAKKAVKAYVEEHVDELMGKSTEELQAIYKQIFRNTD